VTHLPFVLAASGLAASFVPSARAWATALAILLAVGLTYALRGRLSLAFHDRPITPLRRFCERLYYMEWSGSLAAFVLFVLGAPLALLDVVSLAQVALVAYVVALSVAAYAVFVRTRRARVRQLELALPGLPAAFEGYRIAQLSDVHVGSLFPADHFRLFVRVANQLDVDLMALTGDYVTSGTRFHEEAARALCELSARDGSIAILGNHDNFGECEPLSSALRSGGVRLLANSHETIKRGDAELVVVGVDDTYTRRADVEASFADVPEGAFTIALAHDPKLFHAIAERGARLVLAGHTHWGQIGIPFLAERFNLGSRFFKYAAGLYEHAGAKLYVHPGIGCTGPPVRFGVAPEITVFVLRRG